MASQAIGAWFVPSATKVMRKDKPKAKSPAKWDLAAARNEVESCQLVLRADHDVAGVTVSAAPLKHTKGKATLKPTLLKVEYVPIWEEEKELFPDPLPPLRGALKLQAKQSQPIWIMIKVPASAAPGTYRGSIKVKAGKWQKSFPLSIKVWDFALPVTPASKTAFGIDYGGIAEAHGVDPKSDHAKQLYRKYCEFLLDHRLSPYSLPVDIMSKEALPYLNDPRLTSFNVLMRGKTDEQLVEMITYLKKGGWFEKSYFYEVDEPITKEAFDKLVEYTDHLHKLEPRCNVMTPFWGNPNWDEKVRTKDVMLDRVNMWCPCAPYLEAEPGFHDFLMERKHTGEKVWWYVCGGITKWDHPFAYINNLDIPIGPMQHRMFGFQQRRLKLQGFLYWNTTFWHKQYTQDVWTNTITLEPRKCGDGSLAYPGNKVGVDGPVSCIRMEIFRDSQDDFDYLALADERLGPEVTEKYVSRVCKSLAEYERDPMKLEKVRRELGDALEKATVAARKRL
jgi:hypothetical protein